MNRSDEIIPALEKLTTRGSEILELYKVVHTGIKKDDLILIESLALELITYMQTIRAVQGSPLDSIPF